MSETPTTAAPTTPSAPSARRTRRRRGVAAALVATAVLAVGGVAHAHHSFPDVPAGAFYHNAVGWALDNGLTDGYGDSGMFRPELNITRGETVTFLHRYHQEFSPTQTLAARVQHSGALQGGVGATEATRPGTGHYRVSFDRDVSSCWPGVTPNSIGGVPQSAAVQNVSGNVVTVRTANPAGAATNVTFWLTVTCATP